MFAQENKADFALPALDYDFAELEPAISAEIMQIHYSKHHQAYVNNLNIALENYSEAEHMRDLNAMIALEPVIRFNGGGHINHSLFWKMLAPVKKGGGVLKSGSLSQAIDATFGSFDAFKEKLTAASVGIQGSGWGWLAYNKNEKRLVITTCANQDPVSSQANGALVGLLGIDVWEHAYYLQYKNARADYVKSIFSIINWDYVQERYTENLS